MNNLKKPFLTLDRRRFLQSAGALAAAAGTTSLGLSRAFAEEPAKPKELIVRAWGGAGWMR